MAKRPQLLVVAAIVAALAVGYWLTRTGSSPADGADYAAAQDDPRDVDSLPADQRAHEPADRTPAPAGAPDPSAQPVAGLPPDDLPPAPPSVMPERNRPDADPLTEPELVGKQQRGVELMDLALARLDRELKAAEQAGDDDLAAQLRVRRDRLQARRQERVRELTGAAAAPPP